MNEGKYGINIRDGEIPFIELIHNSDKILKVAKYKL